MKLSAIKEILRTLQTVEFQLENGIPVPEHFHVTEVGQVIKSFIDCGGVIRQERIVSLQLWNADDYAHRLKPEKLLRIIALSEEKLGIEDGEVEVEYQSDTIGRYDLAFDGQRFLLKNKATACLAPGACCVADEKPKVNLSALPVNPSCSPGSGCC